MRGQEAFFAFVEPYLPGLTDFVGHELASAEAVGDLARGAISTVDLVDSVLLEASGQFSKDLPPTAVRAWLTTLALRRLETEIARARDERDRTVHVEEHVTATPPEENAITLGDEILDYYQPDEDLKLEDLIPSLEGPTPEEEAELDDVRAVIRASLRRMPDQLRRVIVLHHMQGLTIHEVSAATGKSELELHKLLQDARRYLRRMLTEAGCTVDSPPARGKVTRITR
jgi:RNA polymerase sigma factor (sigma-70 family)